MAASVAVASDAPVTVTVVAAGTASVRPGGGCASGGAVGVAWDAEPAATTFAAAIMGTVTFCGGTGVAVPRLLAA